jgi:hypothetical protein
MSPQSQVLNKETKESALKYINDTSANLGGTELFKRTKKNLIIFSLF